MGLEQHSLSLAFTHVCLSQACRDSACHLCQHNPAKQCKRNFAGKYLVDDVFQSSCGATVHIAIVDGGSRERVAAECCPSELQLQVAVLDGVQYEFESNRTPEGTPVVVTEQMILTRNKEKSALLVPCGETGDTVEGSLQVAFPLYNGYGPLPSLTTSASSEAMLSGRKPPFRLWVRVMGSTPAGQHISDVVSEPFVVATRRVKAANKLDTPSIMDHVGKLHSIGKESVRKLQDIRGAALEAGINLPLSVEINKVQTVGDFQRLASAVDASGDLHHALLAVIKLSAPKWIDAVQHAQSAVLQDDKLRAWYVEHYVIPSLMTRFDPTIPATCGLLYACRTGQLSLGGPVALLTNSCPGPSGSDPLGTPAADFGLSLESAVPLNVVMCTSASEQQQDMIQGMHAAALACWSRPGHPGWRKLEADTSVLLSSCRPVRTRRPGAHLRDDDQFSPCSSRSASKSPASRPHPPQHHVAKQTDGRAGVSTTPVTTCAPLFEQSDVAALNMDALPSYAMPRAVHSAALRAMPSESPRGIGGGEQRGQGRSLVKRGGSCMQPEDVFMAEVGSRERIKRRSLPLADCSGSLSGAGSIGVSGATCHTSSDRSAFAQAKEQIYHSSSIQHGIPSHLSQPVSEVAAAAAGHSMLQFSDSDLYGSNLRGGHSHMGTIANAPQEVQRGMYPTQQPSAVLWVPETHADNMHLQSQQHHSAFHQTSPFQSSVVAPPSMQLPLVGTAMVPFTSASHALHQPPGPAQHAYLYYAGAPGQQAQQGVLRHAHASLTAEAPGHVSVFAQQGSAQQVQVSTTAQPRHNYSTTVVQSDADCMKLWSQSSGHHMGPPSSGALGRLTSASEAGGSFNTPSSDSFRTASRSTLEDRATLRSVPGSTCGSSGPGQRNQGPLWEPFRGSADPRGMVQMDSSADGLRVVAAGDASLPSTEYRIANHLRPAFNPPHGPATQPANENAVSTAPSGSPQPCVLTDAALEALTEGRSLEFFDTGFGSMFLNSATPSVEGNSKRLQHHEMSIELPSLNGVSISAILADAQLAIPEPVPSDVEENPFALLQDKQGGTCNTDALNQQTQEQVAHQQLAMGPLEEQGPVQAGPAQAHHLPGNMSELSFPPSLPPELPPGNRYANMPTVQLLPALPSPFQSSAPPVPQGSHGTGTGSLCPPSRPVIVSAPSSTTSLSPRQPNVHPGQSSRVMPVPQRPLGAMGALTCPFGPSYAPLLDFQTYRSGSMTASGTMTPASSVSPLSSPQHSVSLYPTFSASSFGMSGMTLEPSGPSLPNDRLPYPGPQPGPF